MAARRSRGPRPRRFTLRRVLAGLAALLLLAFVVTEYVYYFPLTPLSLDLRGTTRLPATPNIRLLFVGDVLLGDAARSTLESRGYDHPFGATRQLIRSADLAVGNLEGPIAVEAQPNRRKRWFYKMSPKAAHALRRAGFDAMDLANNHIRDCGNGGVRETLAYLREAQVDAFGAGSTRAEAHRPALHDVRGVRVALLGYVPPAMQWRGKKVSLRGLAVGRVRAGGPSRAGAAWGTLANIRRDIRAARSRGADLVVVSLHLGDRYQRGPVDFERAHCQGVVEAGADAVIAHGTHILGPIGVHQGRPIFYGLGNFTFGSGNVRARFSLMAYLEVDPRQKRIVGLTALPLYTVNRNPWVWWQPKILRSTQARQVLRRLIRHSWRENALLRLRSNPERVTAKL